MTQNKQHNDASPATTDSKRKSGLGHWVRVVVMFLSGGFIFPHAMEEDEENSKYCETAGGIFVLLGGCF